MSQRPVLSMEKYDAKLPRSGLLYVDVPFREEAAWDGIPWEGRNNERPGL